MTTMRNEAFVAAHCFRTHCIIIQIIHACRNGTLKDHLMNVYTRSTLEELQQFLEFWALVLQRPLLAHVHMFGSIQATAEF